MDYIRVIGKIVFNPEDKTKKHNRQSTWKKIAMVMFEGDLAEYYAWYIKKRFNLPLNKPLRGAHISFINDDINKMMNNGKMTQSQVEAKWIQVKTKWNNKVISIDLNPSPRTNGEHWWLKPFPESCEILNDIRNELSLGNPYFSYHLSLGYANEKFIDHSNYIHNLIKQGLIS
jgi:hypothetical protein